MEKCKFRVEGMSCAACVSNVTKAVSKVAGVKNVNVNLLTKSMDVIVESKDAVNRINRAVKNAGYKSYIQNDDEKVNGLKDNETIFMFKRLIFSLILLFPLVFLSMGYMMEWYSGYIKNNVIVLALLEMLLSLGIILINNNFFISGFKSLLHKGPNMDTLVALGSSVSFIYALVLFIIMLFNRDNNDYLIKLTCNLTFETAGMVPTLITIGKTLESFSKGKTTNALKHLLDMTPKYANVLKDGKEEHIKASEVRESDIFIVRAGEQIPVDGVVIEGASSVDEASLTGESMPSDKIKDSKVYGATINQNGVLKCKATSTLKDTTFSKIIALVEDANLSKAPIQKIADKVAGIFVPLVLGISIVVFIVWLIVSYSTKLDINESNLTYSINRAISILVISCPCALGLATPVAIMVGSGVGAKMGILFKNATSIEEAGKISIVVLDKTGTITEGKPSVDRIYSKIEENEFLSLVYSLESNSSHPLAKAINDFASDRETRVKKVSSFETLVGSGVKGIIDEKWIYGLKYEEAKKIVNISSEDVNIINDISSLGNTPLIFIYDNKLIGIVSISDKIKEDSIEAIKEIKEMNIKVVMLTGDNYLTSKKIASETLIDAFYSNLLPNDKNEIINKLKKKGKVLMIGDGINDALALTNANVGVSVGSGTDIAISSSDIVLMKSSLKDALYAIRLSKKILNNIKENLFWAFFYNIIMIPIASGIFYFTNIGFLKEMKPWYGALAMSMSSVFVVTNALRLNLFNKDKKVKIKNSDIDIFEETTYQKTILEVEGMMCTHCEKRVCEAVLKNKNVVSCKASFEKKIVEIEYNDKIKINKIKKAIRKEGYKA